MVVDLDRLTLQLILPGINENLHFCIPEAYRNERLGFPEANGSGGAVGVFISQGPVRIEVFLSSRC